MNFFIVSITSLLMLSFLFSCKEKQNIQSEQKLKRTRQIVKKEAKKQNPKDLLKAMKIDREKTPYAGVWEPNDGKGFLLMFPDGKLELYGRFDKACNKTPKRKGSYKIISNRTIETTINGKIKTAKLKVLSSFIEIEGFGIYWPPTGLVLSEEQKEFTDPKKLIEFCRNVTQASISKIYPYLTNKSKLELLKIGITNKTELASHEKFTSSIDKFLNEYKKIKSIKSIQKNSNGELFKIILKSQTGKTFGENIIVKKEGENLRCGLFNTLKLISSTKNSDELSFWYKEISSKTVKHTFKAKSKIIGAVAIIEVQFDIKNVTIKKLKSDKTLISELTGEFKIIANTPNIVAISLPETQETIVFKYNDKEAINIIVNNNIYSKTGK